MGSRIVKSLSINSSLLHNLVCIKLDILTMKSNKILQICRNLQRLDGKFDYTIVMNINCITVYIHVYYAYCNQTITLLY